jgi:deoxyribodipyrimidine photo-lyase
VAAVLWFRRDLRLRDHPALTAAADDEVVPLFVCDPQLLAAAGRRRSAHLFASLRALSDSIGGRLTVRVGDPTVVVPAVAAEARATQVHVTADCAPFGRRRDARVAAALADDGRELIATGSPYAVTPGRVRTGDGGPYRVFTPFRRAWLAHGWRSPAELPPTIRWRTLPGEPLPPTEPVTAPVGEAAAWQRWEEFRDGALADYDSGRDRPDLSATSGLSAALRFGEIHPRSLLADLDGSRGAEVFRSELAWREFYADVLWHAGSAWEYVKPAWAAMRYDEPDGPGWDAWCTGRTGYPFVDAGIRQLLATGWMHNRVRMVTASFLIKDLHVEWVHGARFFLRHLSDGDIASNNQGWQWVAGCGTDAAPYFRIFNPVTQGLRFDPDGDYVRRWIPELRSVAGAAAHQPWQLPGGPPPGYPTPIVDHAVERAEALHRLSELQAAGTSPPGDPVTTP